MKRDIKEVLSIDLDMLLENATFVKDQVEDDDSKEFLLYDLNPMFLDVYDQMMVRVFNGEPRHLEFRGEMAKENRFKGIVARIADEYGPDQDRQTEAHWSNKTYYGWLFKNEDHEETFDDPMLDDPFYYGILMGPNGLGKSELIILEYSVLEPNIKTKLINKRKEEN